MFYSILFNYIVYECHSEAEWARYLSDFEQGMVEGAKCTGLCQELQHWQVFHAQQFPVCIKNEPPPKGHQANLTQLWEALESTLASIPVECFWHFIETMPQQIEAVLRTKEGNIRKVFLMFCILSVYLNKNPPTSAMPEDTVAISSCIWENERPALWGSVGWLPVCTRNNVSEPWYAEASGRHLTFLSLTDPSASSSEAHTAAIVKVQRRKLKVDLDMPCSFEVICQKAFCKSSLKHLNVLFCSQWVDFRLQEIMIQFHREAKHHHVQLITLISHAEY
jgi:hypothetical protein